MRETQHVTEEREKKRKGGGGDLTDSIKMAREPDGQSRLVCAWETILMAAESASVWQRIQSAALLFKSLIASIYLALSLSSYLLSFSHFSLPQMFLWQSHCHPVSLSLFSAFLFWHLQKLHFLILFVFSSFYSLFSLQWLSLLQSSEAKIIMDWAHYELQYVKLIMWESRCAVIFWLIIIGHVSDFNFFIYVFLKCDIVYEIMIMIILNLYFCSLVTLFYGFSHVVY